MQETKPKFDWKKIRAKIEKIGEILDHSYEDLDVDRILQMRKQRYQVNGEQDKKHGREMVIFQRSGTNYAIPLEALSEIRVVNEYTQLPGLSPVIKGIINISGRLVALHDLAALTKQETKVSSKMWLLVGYQKTSSIALIADDVEGIKQFYQDEIRDVPLSLVSHKESFVGIGPENTIFINLNGLMQNPDFFYA